MSIRSFQGAEIYNLNSEFLLAHTGTIARDTAIKEAGVASWKMASNVADYFTTGKTKAATNVTAACMFNFRVGGFVNGMSYRICTAGTDGGNAGRWYLGYAIAGGVATLKLYKNDGTVQATGSTIVATVWMHFLLIDDGTTAYVYFNGSTTADMTWAHGGGAWNNLPWGPSCVQTVGKATAANHWFDNVMCFDDQDGRMDWITPSGWDGDTSWRVERPIPTGDVVTDYTPSGGGAHYLLVDEEPDDTADHVDTVAAHEQHHIAREGGIDYDLSATSHGIMYDLSPASNEWTDNIYDGISTGQRDGGGNKEILDIEDASVVGVGGVGSERIRAVRYLQQFQQPGAPKEFYSWRDTVLIGPSDPAAAGGRRRWHGGHF